MTIDQFLILRHCILSQYECDMVSQCDVTKSQDERTADEVFRSSVSCGREELRDFGLFNSEDVSREIEPI